MRVEHRHICRQNNYTIQQKCKKTCRWRAQGLRGANLFSCLFRKFYCILSHWPQLSFLVWITQEKLGKVIFTLSGYVSCWQLASWYENEWETRHWAHSRSTVFYSGSLNLSIDFFWVPVCSAQPSRAFLAKCYLDEQSWLTVTELHSSALSTHC